MPKELDASHKTGRCGARTGVVEQAGPLRGCLFVRVPACRVCESFQYEVLQSLDRTAVLGLDVQKQALPRAVRVGLIRGCAVL